MEELVSWLEKELPKKFKELTEDSKGKESALEKREDPNSANGQNKPNRKGDSILDRIKPRADNKNKRVKTEEGAESEAKPESPEEEGSGDRPKKDPKKVRCTFWPGCKKEDCPFVHPTEQVS